MKRAYIVGKVSGLPLAEVKANFEKKKELLLNSGFIDVMTPFDAIEMLQEEIEYPKPTIGSTEEWQLCMAASIVTLCAMRFVQDGEIHALPNWKDSKGAQIEVELAKKLGIKVVFPPYTVRKKEASTTQDVQKTSL